MAKVLSKPPQLLDSARVLHYANVDKGVGFAGRTLLFKEKAERIYPGLSSRWVEAKANS
jgi:hypothetical protein